MKKGSASPQSFSLATFRFDVTPPMGHPLCGGWITPVKGYDDPLEAIGFVLLGAGAPLVICAVDWTSILNEAHSGWRKALAEAVGTTADRVAIQCVHQHNALFACLETEKILAEQPDPLHSLDVDFYRTCVTRGQAAVAAALRRPRPVTHIAHGQSAIAGVASNRRIFRDAAGRVIKQRGSSCKEPALAALPEGLIDPHLKTIAFFDGETKVLACHYYATHPMSYYGDGRVSADFCGLARRQRQRDEPECTHIYFTGCAGDIGAGKYNDGSPPLRPELVRRMYDGMVASEAGLCPQELRSLSWKTQEILPEPSPAIVAGRVGEQVASYSGNLAGRVVSAFGLAWLRRLERKIPLVLSCLELNDIFILHLPGEPFIDYQLRAQAFRPDRTVAVAGYGDGGPWYLPTREEYPGLGYEVAAAFCAEGVDALLTEGIRSLLQ